MRTEIDVPDDQIEHLEAIARRKGITRPAAIIEAIETYLAADKANHKKAIDAAFGLWADSGEDGLAYQERLRSEWDERSSEAERWTIPQPRGER